MESTANDEDIDEKRVNDEDERNSNNGDFHEKKSSDENVDGKKTKCEDTEKLSWHCWLRTLYAATPAMIVFVFTGITEAQSAVLLPQLKKKSSHIHVTPDEETWIASLGIVLSPISSLLIGPAIDAFGRKKGLQLFYLSMGLGFGIIACAKEVYHIYIGRCICSFATGLEVVCVVYLAEISTTRQRSCFFSLMSAIYSGGVTLTYVVGILPWPVASGIFGIGCFITFIMQCFTPESPSWLYKTGQVDASTKSLRQLGRSPSGIIRELELLKLTSKDETAKFQWSEFFLPTVWKPFAIMVIFHIIQNGSGVFDILYYTVDFIDGLGTSYNPLVVSILISVARFVTNVTAGMYFTASLPRKFAMVFSASGMAVAFTGMGIYEYVYRDTAVKPFQWVPIALLVISIVTCALAMTCLPWLMAGEIFPLQVRGAMTGACFLVGSLLMFVTLKIYNWCLEALQMWGLLLVFAGVSFFGIFFGVFLLPETQNKELYEVEQRFLPKKKRRLDVESPAQQVVTIS